MKKNRLGITEGEVKIRPVSTGHYAGRMDIYTDIFEIAEVMGGFSDQLNNATLIADAFNTANSCGLLPSELLAQNTRLLQALKDITMYCRFNITNQLEPLISQANDAINQIEQQTKTND